VVLALAASRHNVSADPGLVVFGEVGLSGEIRGVGQAGPRLKEAAKLGFNRCILPAKCRKNIPSDLPIETLYVESVVEAVARRTRPILLTTLTTVAGLLPLTFTSSTLWPPMAWSIISGLLAATVLTLGVVPTLSNWLLKPRSL